MAKIKIDATIKNDRPPKKRKPKNKQIQRWNRTIRTYYKYGFEYDYLLEQFLIKLEQAGFDVHYKNELINDKNVKLPVVNDNIKNNEIIKLFGKMDLKTPYERSGGNISKFKMNSEIQNFINEYRDLNAYDSKSPKLKAFGKMLRRETDEKTGIHYDINDYTAEEIYNMIGDLKVRLDRMEKANPLGNKRRY